MPRLLSLNVKKDRQIFFRKHHSNLADGDENIFWITSIPGFPMRGFLFRFFLLPIQWPTGRARGGGNVTDDDNKMFVLHSVISHPAEKKTREKKIDSIPQSLQISLATTSFSSSTYLMTDESVSHAQWCSYTLPTTTPMATATTGRKILQIFLFFTVRV